MSNEIDEEQKLRIAEKYQEIMEKQTIVDASKELGISEGTFHQYKNYKSKKEETLKKDDNEDDNEDFTKKVKPDLDNDTDEDEEINIEQLDIE